MLVVNYFFSRFYLQGMNSNNQKKNDINIDFYCETRRQNNIIINSKYRKKKKLN